MTTKEKIYLYIYNAIDPEVLQTSLFKDIDNFSDFVIALDSGFNDKGNSYETILTTLLKLNYYQDLAEFVDNYFAWIKMDFEMDRLYDYFAENCTKFIYDFNNHKVVKLPTLTYDY